MTLHSMKMWLRREEESNINDINIKDTGPRGGGGGVGCSEGTLD